jgi:hypothetical protein
VRGWLITGRTGSGKTQCAINTITFQLFQNVKNWGGVCLDQKGLYWEILVKMAAHFGREHDLVLLQTRPPGEDALWRAARLPCLPSLTISLSSDERVEIHNRRHTAKRTQNCRENPLLAAQILHAQLLEIFAVFYFVDLGEKRFFEFGN